MATKAGVWIDHKQAVVVLLADSGQEIKRVKSGIEKPGAGSNPKKPYTPNDFVAEDRRERKTDDHRKKFFDEVIASFPAADALLILGPGEAKGEFSKHIKAKKIRGVVVELETADKMTDPQIAALVKQHFAASVAKKPSAKKPVAAKKKAKKAAKAAPAKRKKKASKK
jgi:hypothetical protein